MTPADPKQPAPHYAEAGVDIGANDRLIPRFKELARETERPEVLGSVGPFSGLFDLSGYDNPVLVASTDGVGTKVLLARILGRLDTVGQDLVNHCVNDILTAGARPLFFLDYLANSGLSEDEKVAIVRGVATACRETGTALLGGETADMPDLYRPGDFDLAGTIVGVVDKNARVDLDAISPGDVLLGLPSSGLHTNGYSLVRRVFGLSGADPEREAAVLNDPRPELGESLGDALLRTHLSYWPLLEPVLPRIKGIAHITGGGVPGNLARILPPRCGALVRRAAWPEPLVFALIQRAGEISDEEMVHVFNVGLGLIVAVDSADAAPLREQIPQLLEIGLITDASEGEPVRVEHARVEAAPDGEPPSWTA